jgi:uncharacterized protein YndB with AHSA1/START domain
MLTTSSAEVTVTLPSDREIVFTRHFDRPRHLLFEAWTKPEHLRRWWGCDGSTLVSCDVDLRVGGAWRIVGRMQDGSVHPLSGVYREIVLNSRLVYTEMYENPSVGNPQWLTTITFEEADGGTLLTHTLLHASREVRDGHLQAGMEQGAIQTLNRLDKLTAEIS